MSVSAFGVEHTVISKRRQDNKDASGSAVAAGGGVTTGLGLLGGGIPGIKSNSDVIRNMREPKAPWRQRIGAAAASGRGGIFGYRTDAHQKALNRLRNDYNYYKGKPATRQQMYMRGREAGKIKPEIDVIRHLKRGRLASNALLGAGIATTAYGLNRANNPSKKTVVKKTERDTERYHGALFGGGLTAAGTADITSRVLTGQKKRWNAKKEASLKDAERVIPRMTAGSPSNDIKDNPNHFFAGKSKKAAYDAGVHRGHATQYKYFSNVYGKTARVARKLRNPSLAVAAVGGGGLLLTRKKNEPKVRSAPNLRRYRQST